MSFSSGFFVLNSGNLIIHSGGELILALILYILFNRYNFEHILRILLWPKSSATLRLFFSRHSQ